MTHGGYHNLEVYTLSHALAVRIHKASLSLPKFELYEEGAQIRRSSKRVSASKDDSDYKGLMATSTELVHKLVKFIQAVERQHGTPRYLEADVVAPADSHSDLHDKASKSDPKSAISNQKSAIKSQ